MFKNVLFHPSAKSDIINNHFFTKLRFTDLTVFKVYFGNEISQFFKIKGFLKLGRNVI